MSREDTEKLEKMGWRQFSIFLGNAHPELTDLIPNLNDRDIFIILPYSCAVVNGDFENKEPYIEVLRCRETTLNKSYQWGRDPREIHLGLEAPNMKGTLSAKIYDRFFIPHKLLLEFDPRLGYTLLDKDLNALKYWVAKRYIRQAFPDAFNRRINKVRNKLKEKLAKFPLLEHIQGIYLNIDPIDDELDEDDEYELSIIAIISEEGLGKNRKSLEEFFATYDELFSQIEGVVFNSPIKIESESAITLYEYRQLIRFDDYDFISFKEDHEDPITY